MRRHRIALVIVMLAAVAVGLGVAAPRAEAHDAAITSFTATPNPVSRGQTITFTVVVTNYWFDTDVYLQVTLTALGKVFRQQVINSLGSGQSVTLTFPVKVPRKVKSGDHDVLAQVINDDEEDDPTNNQQTIIVTVK